VQDFGWLTVKGPNSSVEYRVRQLDGRRESYHTWTWPKTVVRNQRLAYEDGTLEEPAHPNDPQEGRPKYSALAWNNLYCKPNPDGHRFDSLKLKNDHRDWATDARDRQLKSAGLSELTIAYCAQGQRMGLQQQYWNIKSHSRNGMGGTNVIFADTHVEWVKGTQVGW
jgi:prepilin-type processing-associated H-X9-DG protein